ncbi:hypothetical protein BHL25_18155 [Bacillus cereus]|nr:hypothetical protein BHL25_18155 [Bacillus cereus]
MDNENREFIVKGKAIPYTSDKKFITHLGRDNHG